MLTQPWTIRFRDTKWSIPDPAQGFYNDHVQVQVREQIKVLLVGDHMTREVIAISPEATAAEALKSCRDKRVRHLPVLKGGELAGVVSDRDLRSATPALGDPARAEALGRIRVSDVMRGEVVTAGPRDPIEQAANTMRQRGIGCLPVLDEERGEELVGILTASDVMDALVYLVGAHEPGSRMEIELEDRPGELAGAVAVIRDAGVNIESVLMAPKRSAGTGPRRAVLRLDTIDPSGVAEGLRGAGYKVGWPPYRGGR